MENNLRHAIKRHWAKPWENNLKRLKCRRILGDCRLLFTMHRFCPVMDSCDASISSSSWCPIDWHFALISMAFITLYMYSMVRVPRYWIVKAFTAPESVLREGDWIPFMDSFKFPPLLLLFLSRNASSNTIKIDNHEALWVHFENLLAAVQKTRIIPFGAARKQSRANMFVSEWIKVTGLWNLCRSMAFGREVVQKFMWILFSCCLTQAILAYRFSAVSAFFWTRL